ncbi:hypothetical protein TWF696_002601 [Orbilia brochopaga]|uniref:Eisosome protein 1 n=1 Tax=Orbilia brochopaga TaxID=3140254 RepID=A0AAV9U1R7_9PEZI
MFGFGTKSSEVPDTNDTPIFEPPAQQSNVDENLVFSTPRSELNNPMADSNLLAESGNTSKATSSKATSDPSADSAKKLSRAGASASLLRRADPKDLPSYPSRGIQNLEASAGKAALLAAKTKSPEPWKPADRLPAAGAAASLANAAKPPEAWNPGPLPTATAAALLAGDAHKTPEIWRPTTPSRSATKAAGSVTGKGSVDHTPRSPPMSISASDALAAAGLASQASPKKASLTASALPPTPAYDINKINALAAHNAQARLASALQRASPSQAQTDKDMADVLRAASVSMSKKTSKTSQSKPSSPPATSMPPGSYYSRIPTSPPKVSAAESSTQKLNRSSSVAAASIAASNDLHSVMSSETAGDRQMRYCPHLEEAARKAAAERLSKLQAEHDKARKASGLPPSWQSSGSYTKSITSPSTVKSTSSTTQPKGQIDAADYVRSLKIKSDTAKLAKQMDSVDKDRQARDYLALLSVAEKNVRSRMQELETKVAEHQGRVPKHIQADWDAKAKILSEEYERKRNADREAKKGKIDMGGGLWYDREDLERIARGNVQPILDEINEKAQKERARVEQQKLDKEQADREKKAEAERLAETKAELKKAKASEKAAAKSRRDAEKAEERQRKAELKESQRQQKERLKASKQAPKPAVFERDGIRDDDEDDDDEPIPSDSRSDSEMTELEPRPMSQAGHARVERERELHEAAKRERGFFGSIQKRLVRRGSASKQDAEQPSSHLPDRRDSFDIDQGSEVSSLSSGDRASARDVAFAGAGGSIVSDDDAASGRRGSDTNLDAGAGARKRYISSSDSGSTSSDDLYTVSPPYKPLTSATYNPGLAGEDDMPAFVAGRAASISSASNGGDDGAKESRDANGAKIDANSRGKVSPMDRHDTFGNTNTLAERVNASFGEFAQEKEKEEKGGTEQEVEGSGPSAATQPQDASTPSSKLMDLRDEVTTGTSATASTDNNKPDVRPSRFNEIL